MNEFIVKVMSCFCKMVDIIDKGISCKHCFCNIYIACSYCNDKIVNNLIVSFSHRVFFPSVFKEDAMHTYAMIG